MNKITNVLLYIIILNMIPAVLLGIFNINQRTIYYVICYYFYNSNSFIINM